MCGFLGGTEPGWNYRAGLQQIVHRGPDASGLLLDGPVYAGFRRLSIIDLDISANQPMLGADGSSWIVFNGELYGYAGLRQQLEKLGHRFHTRSDTEVMLRAWEQWHTGFVDHIDGMFAIALWDAGAKELHLFRDRAGIKPLYYFFDGHRFAFASELKALQAALEPAALEVDETALYDFLGYRYVPAPKTLYRRCFKLEPGCHLSFSTATRKLQGPRRYWDAYTFMANPRPPTTEPAEALRELISDSVQQQMIADVPLGFFLSGGIDSSVVVAAAAATGQELATFSIGFDRDDVSETPFARAVAVHCNTRHTERILLPDDARSQLEQLKQWFDEPFADVSALPTYLVSRVAREQVTVVLTGDGGDEVFGGYRTYPRYARYSRWPSLPASVSQFAARLRTRLGSRNAMARALKLLETGLSEGPALWARIMAGMPEGEKVAYRDRFAIPDDYDDWWHYRQHWHAALPLYSRLQLLDFNTFLPGLVLTKVDRTSMAVSLEARVPLLAQRLIEFVYSLPEEIRLPGLELKGLLKQAYRGILPDEILARRKKGFGIPRYYLRDMSDGIPVQALILNRLFL